MTGAASPQQGPTSSFRKLELASSSFRKQNLCSFWGWCWWQTPSQTPLTEQGHQEENDDDVGGVLLLVEIQQQAEEDDLHQLQRDEGGQEALPESWTLGGERESDLLHFPMH